MSGKNPFLVIVHDGITMKIKALLLISSVLLTACEPKQSADARSLDASETRAQTSPNPVASPSADVAYRFVTAQSGNSARYRIREQLVGVDLPNDAVGETRAVTGVISADKTGKIIPADSKFTVDVSNLVSDKERRDGFVKRRVLQTDQYPTVTLVPTSLKGLSIPLPTSGTKTFDLIGDLTVRGETHPTTWKVTAQFNPTGMTGKAATAFTFKDFAIDQPRVPVVLSVADTIRLELDFSMARELPKR
jgi:polyisoprenoid-binding protein YceI